MNITIATTVNLVNNLVMSSVSASEAAKAVNSLLHLSSGDQDALLEVLDDYFMDPSRDSCLKDCDFDSDDDCILEDGSKCEC